MQILTYLLLLPLCAVLVSARTLQMDKNLQYNCYYQILKQYSTKSSYEYEEYSDYSHRLDDQLHLSVNQNNNNNNVLHKHIRREILSGVSENNQNDLSKKITNSAHFEKSLNEDLNYNAKSVFLGNDAKEPTHFIVASKIIHPGFVYKVSATVVQSEYPIKIYANISCDGVHLTGDSKDVQEGTTETLLLRIPNQKVSKKECKLRLEGFYLNVFCDSALLHEKPLEYSQKFVMKIFIQTDKPLYMQGDIVRFRVFALDMDLKGTDSVVEIFLLDPKQYITQRWLKRLSNSGTILLEYQLPGQPSFGDWTIKVVLIEEEQQDEIQFTVEEYYPTKVEINVTLPDVIFTTDSFIKGHVEAKFLSGEYAKGNLTLEGIIRPLNQIDYKAINQKFRLGLIEKTPAGGDNMEASTLPKFSRNMQDFLNSTTDYVINNAYYSDEINTTNYVLPQIVTRFDGTFKFEWSVDELEFLQPNMNGFELLVIATVSENTFNEIHAGYAISRIYKPKVRLSFINGSPQVFKPTMQYTVYVVAEFIDNSPLDRFLLKEGFLEVSGIIETDFGIRHSWPTQRLQMLRHQAGIWELKIDMPNDLNAAELPFLHDVINKTKQLKLHAEFISDGIDSTSAELILITHYSPRNQYIKVTTSTEYPTVGEYIIFHISTNFFLEKFNYVVISKDIILVNDYETLADGMRTIALVASAEMTPVATIVVWSVTWQGQIVVDALTFPVGGMFRGNLSLNITSFWDGDDQKKTIGLTVFGEPGSTIGLWAIDKELYYLNSRNDLSNAMNILTYKMPSNRINKHMWHLHEYPYEEYAYYAASTNGMDAHSIFNVTGLVVLTDGKVPRRFEDCGSALGFGECLSKGCFLLAKKCDGVIDCTDGSDESDCQIKNDTDLIVFKKYRTNRVLRHYQNDVFLWSDVEIGRNGKYELNINDSSFTTPWIINGVSSNSAKGIGIINKPIAFLNSPKFSVNIEMPSQCQTGEHVGIRVVISNLYFKTMFATVNLVDSKDYTFVETSNADFIQIYLQQKPLAYHQQLEQQQHQKHHKFTLKLEPQSTRVIYVPIMPINFGDIDIRIFVNTNLGTRNIKRCLKVENPQLELQHHLSLVLDLTKQNYLEYTNVAIIPKIPKFNRIRISASSDQIFHSSFSTSSKQMISLFETAEDNVYAFAIHLNKLKYLRLLSQRNMTAEKKIYYKLKGIYQSFLSFLRADGSFSYLRSDIDNLNSSLQLTAQCLRLLQEAASLHLENYIWIDPQIIHKSLDWLLQHQTLKGAFYEEDHLPDFQHHEMTLTSHVLIALASVQNVTTFLPRIDQAKTRALAWIKYNLQCVENSTNAYELAVTTYALLLWKSPVAAQALNSLRQIAKTSDNFIYWSNVDISTSKLMKLRSFDEYNSLSIETASYALKVYVLNRDSKMHSIVNWLNANRMFNGAWSSRRATAVALCALVDFVKYSAPMQDSIATITVEIEAFSQPGKIHYIHINNSQSSQFQSIEAYDFWGTININAKGVGYALLQFQKDCPVDEFVQSKTSAYKINNKAVLHGKHRAQISYTTCISLLKPQQSADFSLTVLDVTIPTGYGIQQQKLNAYLLNKRLPNLLHAKSLGSRILFHFSALDEKAVTCVNYTLQRWYPVANMTRSLPIRVYNFNAPEYYYQILYDMSPLNHLSICDVCGSSKCSNCLNYSYAVRGVEVFNLLIFISFFLLVF